MTWTEVALTQGGAISAAQLRDAGVTRSTIRALVRSAQLNRVGKRTYLIAEATIDWRGAMWIGLIEAGPGAFAYRRTAASLWGLDGVDDPGPDDVELAVGTGHHPRYTPIRRLSKVADDELTSCDRVPVTTPARTLFDLGSVLEANRVERAVECGLRNGFLSVADLEPYADKKRTQGAKVLRQVLGRRPLGAPPTESDAETAFVQIARMVGLPDPARQVVVILRGRKYRLDFAWREIRLASEIDGAATHGPGQLTADLRRQNQILLDGWLILRFSWPMVTYEMHGVGQDLLSAYRLLSLGLKTGI
jgi:very-short-patch-repair endonuclease